MGAGAHSRGTPKINHEIPLIKNPERRERHPLLLFVTNYNQRIF